jgi:hypothetical protein
MSLVSLAIVVGVALIGLGGVKLICTTVLLNFTNFLVLPNPTVGISILVMVFLTFLAGLLQRFLELLDFLGELREVMIYWTIFLTAFLSGTEIRFLLSVFLKPMALMCVMRDICTPMLLAQVAMLLEAKLSLAHG